MGVHVLRRDSPVPTDAQCKLNWGLENLLPLPLQTYGFQPEVQIGLEVWLKAWFGRLQQG